MEDERKVASFVARALREKAYAVDVAGTGEEGLEMAAGAPYDAIVLDVRLPGMDGLAVCRKIRQAGIEAPVLMLTARVL
ncbi:MAG TPA: response regulator, partial [Terriglobia bacterium]|nr:response regulator [Terriglobia bacterium]